MAGGSVVEKDDDELVGGWRGAFGILAVVALIGSLALFSIWWFVFAVGLLVGPALVSEVLPGGSVIGNGIAAVFFYMVAYGLASIAAFAALGTLSVRGEEAETLDDLDGLASPRVLPRGAGRAGRVLLLWHAASAEICRQPWRMGQAQRRPQGRSRRRGRRL